MSLKEKGACKTEILRGTGSCSLERGAAGGGQEGSRSGP